MLLLTQWTFLKFFALCNLFETYSQLLVIRLLIVIVLLDVQLLSDTEPYRVIQIIP